MVMWIEFAISAFFMRPTIRFVGAEDDPSAVAATAFRIRLAVDLAMVVLVWLTAPAVAAFLDEPEITTILRLFAFDIPIHGRARTQRDVLIGLGRHGRAALATSLRWVARLGLIVLLVQSGLSINGAVLASISASVIEALLSRTKLGVGIFGRLDFPVRRLLDYALPLFLASILMLLFQRLDLFMLKILGASTASVGAYAASQNAALVLGLIGSAVSPAVLSSVSRQRAAGDHDSARTIVRNGLRAVVLLTPLVALLSASAPEIVPFLFGSGFEEGIPVLALLCLASLGIMFHVVANSVLTAAGRPRLVLALLAPVPLSALIGHLMVIPRHGLIGAAAVTCGAALFGALLVLIAVARVWRTLPGPATTARVAATTAAVTLAAVSWTTPGPLVAVKLVVLGMGALLLLVLSGELEASEIRAALSAFSTGRDAKN
jgi:O-antigen/teichoic acid export membrane protein